MSEYISPANTAKLIRKALKREFPGQKFYVNTDTYSMGASIRVEWMDGPTQDEVKAITGSYEGAGFDGMIDLKYYIRAYLMPDGTVAAIKTNGTGGSGGMHSAIEPGDIPEGAREVHFGADYINTERVYSRELVDSVVAEKTKNNGWKWIPEIIENVWWRQRRKGIKCAQFSWRCDFENEWILREFSKSLQNTNATEII